MRWVRVWLLACGGLGTDTMVGSYLASDSVVAERYAAAIGRTYAGLRVTIDPPSEWAMPARELPAERLWTLAP
ncbi:hypothetical protein [Kribbella antibiotica]|uniref:hypothetical protein n=1 Tax=Kribbella antibiotica TaxID=190195 RepID=UPI001EE0FF35|nr:hypothetical protein [Kribbella antibiotica]